MLTRTFIHIPGIGYRMEQRLWRQGILSWQKALQQNLPPAAFSAERWKHVQDFCYASILSLKAKEHRFFARYLPAREHWRAYDSFRSHIGYLDIETDGGYGASSLTVIGLYDGWRIKQFIRGENLGDFAEEIEPYALLVTFNGATFDLPLLKRAFPRVSWEHLHIDLRYLTRQIGYGGGLKQIEKALGIKRPVEIASYTGEDAVRLWREYRRGSGEALAQLLCYNEADVVNLAKIMELIFPQLQARLEGNWAE